MNSRPIFIRANIRYKYKFNNTTNLFTSHCNVASSRKSLQKPPRR